MVLDASLTTRKILEVVLRREGFRVISFGDPVEALQYLRHHRPPALLFLSLDLPRMDGYRVLMYLKSKPLFEQVILVALLDQDDGIMVRLKARLAGAQQTMAKPLLRQHIIALVFVYLGQGTASQEDYLS